MAEDSALYHALPPALTEHPGSPSMSIKFWGAPRVQHPAHWGPSLPRRYNPGVCPDACPQGDGPQARRYGWVLAPSAASPRSTSKQLLGLGAGAKSSSAPRASSEPFRTTFPSAVPSCSIPRHRNEPRASAGGAHANSFGTGRLLQVEKNRPGKQRAHPSFLCLFGDLLKNLQSKQELRGKVSQSVNRA